MVGFAQTKNEIEIVNAASWVKLKDANEDVISNLIDVIKKWQFYVGIKNPTSEEYILISGFICKHYPNLTCEEISLAVDLCLKGQLDLESEEIKPYGTFSPLYVSTILNAYIDFRAEVLMPVMERYSRSSTTMPEVPKMTKEEEGKMMRELILEEYKNYQHTGTVNDYLSMIYDFLKKSKRLVVTEDLKNRAVEAGEKMYKEFLDREREKGLTNLNNYLTPQDQKSRINKFSREYCVMDYFKNHEIIEVVNGIKDDEFA